MELAPIIFKLSSKEKPHRGTFPIKLLILTVFYNHRETQMTLSLHFSHFSKGSLVECRGRIVESQGKGQKYELLCSAIDLIGDCNSEVLQQLLQGQSDQLNLLFQQFFLQKYPIDNYYRGQTHEELRHLQHLRLKTAHFASLMRIRNAATHSIHKYFQVFILQNLSFRNIGFLNLCVKICFRKMIIFKFTLPL